MAYADPNTIHNPATGTIAPASWGDQLRDNDVFLHDPPAARVNGAQQSATSGTDLVLAFNAERFDTDAIHDTVTNNSRLTCKTAGKYLVIGNVAWAANGSGERILTIRLNGTTELARLRFPASVSATHTMHVSTIYQLAVNDYVELIAHQNSGGALNVTANGNYSPELTMIWMSG